VGVPDPSGLADGQPLGVTDAISLTSVRLAQTVGAAAIACLTSSGATARAIARHRPGVPLFAFTDVAPVVAELRLLWGTDAFQIPFQRDTDAGVRMVTGLLRERGLVPEGSLVVFTAGMPLPEKGSTNMIHVTKV
jgi:pyruvate kinase